MDMYILQSPWYICCKPGKIAVKVYGGGALCMDPDQNVPASLHLTVVWFLFPFHVLFIPNIRAD